MYCKKSESVMVDALLILLFIPFFLNMQACESWKVEEPASLLGIQIPITAVSRGPPGMC